MQYAITCTFVLVLSSSVFAQEGKGCPNRGTDPSKFCLPGQIWNAEIEECVNLVWISLGKKLGYFVRQGFTRAYKKLFLLFENLTFVTIDQRNSIFCNLKLLKFHLTGRMT